MPAVDQETMNAGEVNEANTELRAGDVRRLRQWLTTQRHLPHVTDDMLLRIHHSCYYDLERTKDCLDAYYTIRTSTPELFGNRDVTRPELVQALDVMYYAVMPAPDPRGYRIVCNSLRDPDPSKYLYAETNKVLTMTIDACYTRYGLEPGVVLVHDMKGAKLGHLARCSLSVMRKLTQYNQDGNPVRLKEIHILNTVPWIDKVLALLKPFIKKELLNMFKFYTSDNSDALYEVIPKKYLPKEYGGDQVSIEELHVENTKYLERMRDIFAEEEKATVDESKRDKRKSKQCETEAVFRKLEID